MNLTGAPGDPGGGGFFFYVFISAVYMGMYSYIVSIIIASMYVHDCLNGD